MKIKAKYLSKKPNKHSYDLTGRPMMFDTVELPCFVIGHTPTKYKIEMLDNTTKMVMKRNVKFEDILDKVNIDSEYNTNINVDYQFKQ